MKRSTPSVLAVVSGCALLVAAVALLIWNASSSERETSAIRPASAPEMPRKSARSDRLSTESRRNKAGEQPLSPDAREALARLTEAIEQYQDGRLLVEECRKAGVRASDFLELASVIKARVPELGTWNLELVLGAAAEINGQAAAAWYDRNVSNDFLPQHKWIGRSTLFLTVAIDWMRSEPREAIRWVAKHEHLPIGNTPESNLSQIIVYWPQSDFAGQIEWIEEQSQAGSGLVRQVDPAIRFWAKEDPASAVNWMESFVTDYLPSPPVRSRGYEELARGWPADRLDEAVEWLTSRAPGDLGHDAARSVVAERLTKTNPLGAIEVAAKLSDRRREEREELLVRAARNLYRKDPETVIDWLPDSGLAEETQRAILEPES